MGVEGPEDGGPPLPAPEPTKKTSQFPIGSLAGASVPFGSRVESAAGAVALG